MLVNCCCRLKGCDTTFDYDTSSLWNPFLNHPSATHFFKNAHQYLLQNFFPQIFASSRTANKLYWWTFIVFLIYSSKFGVYLFPTDNLWRAVNYISHINMNLVLLMVVCCCFNWMWFSARTRVCSISQAAYLLIPHGRHQIPSGWQSGTLEGKWRFAVGFFFLSVLYCLLGVGGGVWDFCRCDWKWEWTAKKKKKKLNIWMKVFPKDHKAIPRSHPRIQCSFIL